MMNLVNEMMNLNGKMWDELTREQQNILLENDYDLFFTDNEEYLEVVFEDTLKCKCKLEEINDEDTIVIDGNEILNLA